MSPDSLGRLLLTALVSLILTVVPLPPWADAVRPQFLVLAVMFWSVNSPRTGGIAFGFFAGLMLDVFQGPVLGEHALALSLAAYIFVREHQRIRSKPAFQQALIVFAALLRIRAVRHRRLDRAPGHQPGALGAHRDRRPDLAARGAYPRLRCGPACLGGGGHLWLAPHSEVADPCRPYASRTIGASSASSTSAR